MKADEVKALVDTLTERVNNCVDQLEDVNKDQKSHLQSLNDSRRELEKDIAVIKRDVEELKKGSDIIGQRVFTAVLALVCAVIGGVVSHYLKNH